MIDIEKIKLEVAEFENDRSKFGGRNLFDLTREESEDLVEKWHKKVLNNTSIPKPPYYLHSLEFDMKRWDVAFYSDYMIIYAETLELIEKVDVSIEKLIEVVIKGDNISLEEATVLIKDFKETGKPVPLGILFTINNYLGG